MTSNWLGQSLLATALLVPCWLAIGFFDRNFGVKSDVFVIWYYIGVIATTLYTKKPEVTLVPSLALVAGMVVIGATIGAGANVLLYRAVASAPNPGLPIAISDWASVGVLVVALMLGKVFPGFFPEGKIDLWQLIGVLLTVAGVSIIAIRR